MTMRELKRLLVVVLMGACVAPAAWGQREPQPAGPVARAAPVRPNVLFVMADDLGWGDLACYGHGTVKTPWLDQLAREGTLMTGYLAGSPVCSPSRAAILTGRFPAEVGVHSAINADPTKNAARGQVDWLAAGEDLLPHRLRSAGYRTAHFGKWHLGSVQGSPLLEEYGFESHRSVYSASGNPQYTVDRPWKWTSSEQIIDDAIAFLHQADDRPFYLQVWLEHPHAPLDPTPEQAAAYEGQVTGGPSEHGWSSARHCYMSSVTAMDAEIGRLLTALDGLGLREETLVVFVSDNGPESQYSSNADQSGAGHAGPFRGRKRSLYEGGVRVPCIVRWPGVVPSGRVAGATIAGVDWSPTFLSLAGVRPPEGLSGEVITRLLRGRDWERSRPMFSEWRFGRPADEPRIAASPGASVTLGGFKLLRNRDGSRVELYDLTVDAAEVDNLASERPDIVDSLTDLLLGWQSTLGPCVGCGQEGDNSYPWPR